MYINKQTAEDVAEKIVKPLYDKWKAAKAALNAKGVEIVTATVPKIVLDAFAKHPRYVYATGTFYLRGEGIARSISISSTGSCIPYGNSSTVELTPAQAVQVVKLHDKVEAAKQKYETDKTQIMNLLLSLRTFKKIQEHLPEAVDYLPRESSKTQVMLPIKETRHLIKSLTKQQLNAAGA